MFVAPKLPDSLTPKRINRENGEKIPSPSVVYPGEFIVSDPIPGALGCCATQTKSGRKLDNPIFGVPLSNSAPDVAIRSHEYAHLAVEKEYPKIVKKIEDSSEEYWMQSTLDNVVNAFARSRNVTHVNNLPIPDLGETTRKNAAQHMLQCLSVNSSFSPTNKNGLSSLDEIVLRNASRIFGEFGRLLATANQTFTAKRILKKRTEHVLTTLESLQKHFETEEKFEDVPGIDGEDGIGTKLEKKLRERIGLPVADTVRAKPDWMALEIRRATLSESVPRALLGVCRTAGFVGAFRNPLRALLPAFDGRAWDRKQRSIGGNLLIDMSGSMHLTSEQILELLKTSPHATIAGYSGRHDNICTLWILAENGKYCGKIPAHGGCNGADGPALEWLAKQNGSKVWICDGVVTGKNDEYHTQLTLECVGICKKNGIPRITNIADYLQAFRKKAS
jgi:hypothetical protein